MVKVIMNQVQPSGEPITHEFPEATWVDAGDPYLYVCGVNEAKRRIDYAVFPFISIQGAVVEK